MAVLAALALALAGVVSTPSAAAATQFSFTGGGYGHGVGLSQYGACGMAQAGHGYTQILTHYFTGTQVSAVAEPTNLRVAVGEASTFSLEIPAGASVSGVGVLGSSRTVTVRRSGGHAVLSGGLSATVPLPLVVTPHGAVKVSPPGNRFDRGRIVVNAYGSSSMRAVVDGLSTRDYLLGIGEVSASWPTEALKAQAVTARTVAVHKDAHPGGSDHDLKGWLDGYYIGADMASRSGSNWSRWVSAVDATAGRVITHSGSPIASAVFSSSSGGHTANSESVWYSALPYLRGVSDPYDSGCGNSLNRWTKTFSGSELGSRLGMSEVTNIAFSGTLDVSGRTDKASFTFTDRTGARSTYTGAQLRSKLGLYSTKFTISGVSMPSSTPNSPPTGSLVAVRAHEGRNILVAGRATDPDGTPQLFVADAVDGRTTWHLFPTAGGNFLAAFPASPGTHTTCVAVLDAPTGAATQLGCHQTVIK